MSAKTTKPGLRDVNDLWRRLTGFTPETQQTLRDTYGIDLAAIDDMQDDDNYLYLPLRAMVRVPESIARSTRVMVIMGRDHVITVQEQEDFAPFHSAFKHIHRHPETLRNPQTLTCLLFHVLNEQASRVIAAIGASVEETSDTISEITRSLNSGSGTLGIADINDTIIELNRREELVSRCLESQLALARAVRYLDAEVPPQDDLQPYVRTLRDDISGVKEHAVFEHESVRYLQNAILASLNVKQNQIVKVFTIITAVFLPPTLIASIYGMNFEAMPELRWEHGFPASLGLMMITALLPLFYIKVRGWLR